MDVTREPAITFVNQLRSARLAALGDAEAFDGVIHVIERLGSYLSEERLIRERKIGSLFNYFQELKTLALRSGPTEETPHQFRTVLTPFDLLFCLVRMARNDALHQGAFARHLTKHSIELSIILEDALSTHMNPLVTDFMIRNPVCAEMWQPVGFIRQQMLANSYSCLPVFGDDGCWYIVSDTAIATFLGSDRQGLARRKSLAVTLKHASGFLVPATFVDETASLADALNRLMGTPLLLVNNATEPNGLLGILTVFDLL